MENLFNKYFLNHYIDAYRKQLNEDIDSLEITESSDIEKIVEKLISKATIQPIEIFDPKPLETKETSVQRQNMFQETYNQKVYEIFVTIPFTGNYELFDCHPSTSTIVYLDKGVPINRNNVTATIVLDDLYPQKYNAAVNKILETLKSNLPRIHAEIKPWNDGLDGLIRQTLEQRKGTVAKKHGFMEQIGLKVNPSSDEFLVPNPVRKKSIPKPILDSDSTSTNQKEATTVIETAKTEINNHPQFNKYIGDSYYSSSSYLLTLPEDFKKTIEMEVMFFHFPK